MAFTADQLENLGFIRQPDGSYSSPHATTPPKPMDPKTKAHPHGLPHPKPQQTATQALDGGTQGEAGGKAGTLPSSPGYRLLITRYAPRSLDADNLAGGCKGLIDAVRRAALIPDDDPKSVELVFAQQSCKRGDERTEIEVFERA